MPEQEKGFKLPFNAYNTAPLILDGVDINEIL